MTYLFSYPDLFLCAYTIYIAAFGILYNTLPFLAALMLIKACKTNKNNWHSNNLREPDSNYYNPKTEPLDSWYTTQNHDLTIDELVEECYKP